MSDRNAETAFPRVQVSCQRVMRKLDARLNPFILFSESRNIALSLPVPELDFSIILMQPVIGCACTRTEKSRPREVHTPRWVITRPESGPVGPVIEPFRHASHMIITFVITLSTIELDLDLDQFFFSFKWCCILRDENLAFSRQLWFV